MKQTLSNAGIGASEIAAVCGLNPFTSPWDVWLRKTGQADDQPSNPAIEWGHRLEPAIRQKYVDDSREVVYVPTESLFHATTKFARATPDGIALTHEVSDPGVGRDIWKHLIQCKNVGFWTGKEWEAAPPVYVQLQEQWELYVTGLDRADVAALIAGSDFRVYTIHRDDKTITDLVTLAADFWRKVEQRIPPEIDNSDACREHFEKRFAKANAVELMANDEIEDVFSTWHGYVKESKRITKEIERIRNVVRGYLADAQANRIVSRLGIAKLGTDKPTLYAPREWAKDEIA